MPQARRFTPCMFRERFPRQTQCTNGACSGCYEINSPMDRGLCPPARFRSSPIRSRADSLTAGTNSPPRAPRVGRPWRCSSHFRTFRAPSPYGSFLRNAGGNRYFASSLCASRKTIARETPTKPAMRISQRGIWFSWNFRRQTKQVTASSFSVTLLQPGHLIANFDGSFHPGG